MFLSCDESCILVVANEGQRIDIPDGTTLENSEYRVFYLRSLLNFSSRACIWKSQPNRKCSPNGALSHSLKVAVYRNYDREKLDIIYVTQSRTANTVAVESLGFCISGL